MTLVLEAEETDRREDELHGEARGDELPEQVRTAEGRKRALAAAKRRLHEPKDRDSEQVDAVEERAELDMAVERFVTHSGGRVNWFREARRQLEGAPGASAPPDPTRRSPVRGSQAT
jgi:hypothetical protein